MTNAHDPNVLPAELPVPQDDGAARHLPGLKLPSLMLAATDGSQVDLSKLAGRTVVYVYPRTGVPGQPSPEGWDQIPGARGCTPQSCSFRDHFAELKELGVSRVYGLSTQDTGYQSEAGRAPAPAVSDPVGRRSCARPRHRAADLHRGEHDIAQAHGTGHRHRRHLQGFLSGIPAGPERRRGDRLAACGVAPMAKSKGVPHCA
jgi:Redoxin